MDWYSVFFDSKCVKVDKLCILHIYTRADVNALRTKKSTYMSKECNTAVYEELGKLYDWMSKMSVNAVKASLWHCLSHKFPSHAL